MNYRFVNSRFERVDQINANNRGFLYGDGFFETLLLIDGIPTFWKEREERINRALKFLRLKQIFSLDDIAAALRVAAKEQKAPILRARITFTRGGEGKYLPITSECEVYLNIEGLSSLSFNTLSPKSVDFSSLRVPTDQSGNFKLINKHYQVLAALEAKERGLEDLIVLNTREELCESVSGNLFIVQNGSLFTPSLRSGCLDGIIRHTLIQNEDCFEKTLVMDDVRDADAIFTTNSIAGITQLTIQSNGVFENETLERLKGGLKQRLLNSTQDLLGSQQ